MDIVCQKSRADKAQLRISRDLRLPIYFPHVAHEERTWGRPEDGTVDKKEWDSLMPGNPLTLLSEAIATGRVLWSKGISQSGRRVYPENEAALIVVLSLLEMHPDDIHPLLRPIQKLTPKAKWLRIFPRHLAFQDVRTLMSWIYDHRYEMKLQLTACWRKHVQPERIMERVSIPGESAYELWLKAWKTCLDAMSPESLDFKSQANQVCRPEGWAANFVMTWIAESRKLEHAAKVSTGEEQPYLQLREPDEGDTPEQQVLPAQTETDKTFGDRKYYDVVVSCHHSYSFCLKAGHTACERAEELLRGKLENNRLYHGSSVTDNTVTLDLCWSYDRAYPLVEVPVQEQMRAMDALADKAHVFLVRVAEAVQDAYDAL